MYGHVAQEAQLAGLDVDLEGAGVGAERPGDRLRPEERARVKAGRALAQQGRAPQRRARQLPDVDSAPGHAGDVRAAIDEHDVSRRALQELARDQPRLPRDLARRARDCRPRHRRDAARDRAVAVADDGGVAAHDDDPFGVHAELGRAHLRQRGLVGLALRGDADLEIDRPARIDPHVGALEWPDAGAFEVRGQPDTDRFRRSPARSLGGTPLVVAEAGEQAVERGRKIGGIVHDRHTVAVAEARRVGHLVGANEVAPPQRRGIDPAPPRGAIEKPVEHVGDLGSTGAPIRGGEGLVGDHVDRGSLEMRDAVRPGQVVDRIQGDHVADHGIRAAVAGELGLQCGDRAVLGHAEPRSMALVPVGRRRQEVLATGLDPLHGPPQPARHRGQQDVLGIDVTLGAETAPDVGRDHTHLLLGEPECRGDCGAHRERDLS